MSKWIAGNPNSEKIFIVDKDTSHISVEYYIFNQWYGTGQNGEIVGQFLQVTNNRTGLYDRHDYVDYANIKAIYHRRQDFTVNCLAGDEITVRFISPDPGNGNQRPRFRNVKVWSDALGNADLP